jgi:site-specific DNA-methyltransferase (adenine-specific)
MPYRSHTRRRWEVTHADCFDEIPKLQADSVDTVISDPPYGISINGLDWDRPSALNPQGSRKTSPAAALQLFSTRWASECLRVLKPGAYLAAFADPRSAHRLALGLEEAGFELRDILMWLHSQGIPAPSRRDAGRSPALKPAYEPIVLARKPLAGTLDNNLTTYGTGALNVDACRVTATSCAGEGRSRSRVSTTPCSGGGGGRWPSDVLLSHGDGCTRNTCERDCPIHLLGERHRFFYCAKAQRREREAGCEQLPRRTIQTFNLGRPEELERAKTHLVANIHPTVKPIDLMRWLVRLLTPSDGLVLDPFAGSGSTGAAAVLEGVRFHGIEREASYVPIARARITHWSRRRPQCTAESARTRRTAEA